MLCGPVMLMWLCASVRAAVPAKVGYNRDVRPILSDKCFRCHGPDAQSRKADLRLDVREAALAEHDGVRTIVPGNLEDSDLMRRVLSADEDEVMPPPKSNLHLSKNEIEILKQWIAQGAEYEPHWAFVQPVAAPSVVTPRETVHSEIDRFVLAKLQAEGLSPSPEAEKGTLLRRVTLDLTGLPPTLAELDAYLGDGSPSAYERVVDRLLASPRFGERMAVDWLDAARYADTNGYFGDKTRSVWPWRDWVIRAFNANRPFDRFTIEQLAGDLLPGATVDQRIATGFNRNSMANNESGIIDEEYRVETIVDRLETTGTTWLGLTVGCAQCHDHKYDPLSQKEYYQLFAFFNNTPEAGLLKGDNPPPVLPVPTAENVAETRRLAGEMAAAESRFAQVAVGLEDRMRAWESGGSYELCSPPVNDTLLHLDFEEPTQGAVVVASEHGEVVRARGVRGSAVKFDGSQHFESTAQSGTEADAPWSVTMWVKADGPLSCVASKIEPKGNRRGWEILWQKGRLRVNLVNEWNVNALEVGTTEPLDSQWHHLIVSYDGSRRASGLTLMADGVPLEVKVERDTLRGSISNEEPLRVGRRDEGLGFYGQLDELRLLRRTVGSEEARAWFWGERVRGILATAADKRDKRDKQVVKDYFVSRYGSGELREAYAALLAAVKSEETLRSMIPSTLVMQDLPKPRMTHVLLRGVYDQPGTAVQPEVPAVFPPLPQDAPRNRLGFARWLVSEENPLTARVAVNRLWQQCFGEGLVRTVNDFGLQGEVPTHPALLDWLAVRFMRSGWDVKAMLRMMVTSATYRQTSASTPALQERDPENRLLAHGPRFRLSAEMLRDQALAFSGQLVDRVGGASVMPWQPPGLWEAVSYNGEQTYVPDPGEGLWRRSVYTFWKRQAPSPALATFDAPTREKCTVRRARTNTPLQALVMLNDETHVHAARSLAWSILGSRETRDDDLRLRRMFRTVTSRVPEAAETAAISGLLQRQRARFSQDESAARALCSTQTPSSRVADHRELAAWTLVAQTLLNLDEIITRR